MFPRIKPGIVPAAPQAIYELQDRVLLMKKSTAETRSKPTKSSA